jgi:hypothetical protein
VYFVCSTVVGYSLQNIEFEGLNPTTSTGEVEKLFFASFYSKFVVRYFVKTLPCVINIFCCKMLWS